MFTRRELDQLILDVEFVIISVVQGVALTTLAVESTLILRGHHEAGYAFVASGLLFVLAFWSAALIRGRRVLFERSAALKRLYADIIAQQRRDMFFFMPAGLAFNVLAYVLVVADASRAMTLAWIQFALTLGFLVNLVREFSRRQRLITDTAEG